MKPENETNSSGKAMPVWPFYLASVLLLYIGFAVWYIANIWARSEAPSWQLMGIGSLLIISSMIMLVWPAILSIRMRMSREAMAELREQQNKLFNIEFSWKGYENAIDVIEKLTKYYENERLGIHGDSEELSDWIGQLQDGNENLTANGRHASGNGYGELSASDASAIHEKLAELSEIAAKLGEMREKMSASQEYLERLEAGVQAASKQISYLPEQGRLLSGKIDRITTSLGDSRYRKLLKNILKVYDLVDDLIKHLATSPGTGQNATHCRNYDVIRSQIRQILDSNGLSEITVEGEFDPAIHRAVERLVCDDPELSGKIRQVVRPGFRTEHEVLRYADVSLWYYQPPIETESKPPHEGLPGA